MSFSAVVVAAVALLIVGVLAAKAVVIVPQHHRAVLERLGRYTRTLQPGVNLVVPILDAARRVDLRPRRLEVPEQVLPDRARHPVRATAVVHFQVVDAAAATYNIADAGTALQVLTATALGNTIGGMDANTAIGTPEEVRRPLLAALDDGAGHWGLQVTALELSLSP